MSKFYQFLSELWPFENFSILNLSARHLEKYFHQYTIPFQGQGNGWGHSVLRTHFLDNGKTDLNSLKGFTISKLL